MKNIVNAILSFLYDLLAIVVFPFILLYLLIKPIIVLFINFFSHFKSKKTHYERDFPSKFTLLDNGSHIDSYPYTVIKESGLPIEYIKHPGDYKLRGYFIYKDVLLVFHEPLTFISKMNQWFLFKNEEDEYSAIYDNELHLDIDMDSFTDKPLTAEEAKKYLLEDLHENIPERKCNKVVFFYTREYLECMNAFAINDFVIAYESEKLEHSIRDWIEAYSYT